MESKRVPAATESKEDLSEEDKAKYDLMDQYMEKAHNMVGMLNMTALAIHGTAVVIVDSDLKVRDITAEYLGVMNEETTEEK